MSTFLSPRQFAAAIGVSESSIRRWADCGRIKISRTAGGHRKIAREEAIRFVHENSANVVRPDLLEISEPKHRRQRVEAFAMQFDQVAEVLENGDAELFFGLITGMYVNGVSAAEICDGVLRHAMHRIGQRWPDDDRGILIEHRATSICLDGLNRLRSSFVKPASKRVVATGGAPGNDPYILPSLMATTVLADVGFEVVNLGPNTPFDVLYKSAKDAGAKLIWAAMTSPLPKTRVERDLENLVDRLRGQAHVVLGGRASRRYRTKSADNLHVFSSMSELAGFARGFLATAQDEKGRGRVLGEPAEARSGAG
jgi:excisionase family DNA binding protein